MNVGRFKPSKMMKRMNRKFMTIVIILVIILSGFAIYEVVKEENLKEENNWSQMGHDARHTGKSLAHIGEGNKVLLWRKTYPIFLCEEQRGGLLFYKGLLYRYRGDFLMGGGSIEAIDMKTGNATWVKYFNLLSDAAILQDKFYVAGIDTLYALDLQGNLKWKMDLGSVYNLITIGDDRLLYCNSKSVIYAIYPTDAGGIIRWSKIIKEGIYGRVSQYGNLIYFVTSSQGTNYLYALSTSDGGVRWKYKINGFATVPVIDRDGTAYFWASEQSARYLFAVNSDGKLKWKTKLSGRVGERLAIDDDISRIYTSGDVVRAIDLHTGKIIWEKNVTAYDFTIGGDGTLYLYAEKGIYALYSDGEEKWHFIVTSSRYEAPPPIMAYNYIIVVDNLVVVLSPTEFYAIGVDNTNAIIKISVGTVVAVVAIIIIWKKLGKIS